MMMVDQTPMILLAVVLILVIGAIGFWVLRSWRNSRSPTPQDPPEVANDRWLHREAENAARHRS
jgi:hypothetical protein